MPWDIHIDPESGVEYYYNTASGETCWELPEDDPLAVCALKPKAKNIYSTLVDKNKLLQVA